MTQVAESKAKIEAELDELLKKFEDSRMPKDFARSFLSEEKVDTRKSGEISYPEVKDRTNRPLNMKDRTNKKRKSGSETSDSELDNHESSSQVLFKVFRKSGIETSESELVNNVARSQVLHEVFRHIPTIFPMPCDIIFSDWPAICKKYGIPMKKMPPLPFPKSIPKNYKFFASYSNPHNHIIPRKPEFSSPHNHFRS